MVFHLFVMLLLLVVAVVGVAFLVTGLFFMLFAKAEGDQREGLRMALLGLGILAAGAITGVIL